MEHTKAYQEFKKNTCTGAERTGTKREISGSVSEGI